MYPPHPQAAYPAQQMGGIPPQQAGIPQMGGVPPQGYAAHPNFAPGPPMPGFDRNGVPMHGSVPGQPANPQQRPGQQPPLQQGGQPVQQGGQAPAQGGQVPVQGGQVPVQGGQ